MFDLTAKNATAHKVNFSYTLAISYCTFCIGIHPITGRPLSTYIHCNTTPLSSPGTYHSAVNLQVPSSVLFVSPSSPLLPIFFTSSFDNRLGDNLARSYTECIRFSCVRICIHRVLLLLDSVGQENTWLFSFNSNASNLSHVFPSRAFVLTRRSFSSGAMKHDTQRHETIIVEHRSDAGKPNHSAVFMGTMTGHSRDKSASVDWV